MSDRTLDACRWHVEPEAHPYKQRALDHFVDRYGVLLAFFRNEGLVRDPTFGTAVTDWMAFELKESDLTDEGLALFSRCTGTWNPSFGQGRTQRHLVQWKKKLARLRAESAAPSRQP
jgi:hypothetical protein